MFLCFVGVVRYLQAQSPSSAYCLSAFCRKPLVVSLLS